MAKDLVKKEDNQLATHQETSSWGGAMPQLSQRDVIIPAILLMQPMSPQVTEEKAAFGEFRESLNQELLGKFDDGFEVIPFKMQKLFVEYVDLGDEKEFHQTFDITPQNENLPYLDEALVDGKKVKIQRDRVLKFLVLLKKEVELGASIPYTISFKRTSFQAGQKLATQMFIKNINSGKTPASTVMKVSAKKMSHEKLTWAAMDVSPVGPTPDKMVAEAFKWLTIVNSGAAKEHTSEEVNKKTGEIKEDIPY